MAALLFTPKSLKILNRSHDKESFEIAAKEVLKFFERDKRSPSIPRARKMFNEASSNKRDSLVGPQV